MRVSFLHGHLRTHSFKLLSTWRRSDQLRNTEQPVQQQLCAELQMMNLCAKNVTRTVAVLVFAHCFSLTQANAQHAEIENLLATCDYPQVMGQANIGFRDRSLLEFVLEDFFKRTTVQIPVTRTEATDRYGFLELVCKDPGCITIVEAPLQPGVRSSLRRRSSYSFPYCESSQVEFLVRLFNQIQ